MLQKIQRYQWISRIYLMRPLNVDFFFHRLECRIQVLIYVISRRLYYLFVVLVLARVLTIVLLRKSARCARVKNRYVVNAEPAAMFAKWILNDAKTVKDVDEHFVKRWVL